MPPHWTVTPRAQAEVPAALVVAGLMLLAALVAVPFDPAGAVQPDHAPSDAVATSTD